MAVDISPSRPHKSALDAYWMPFTPNRQFKAAPRLVERAEGMHYWTPEGRQILDGVAGLWCVNAGHNRRPIVEAIQRQAATLDYAMAFNLGHPAAFTLADRLAALCPGNLDHLFFTGSGSESVETALKIALAYHQLNGDARRTRLIGRERGYHGVGFGGISVGGLVKNRLNFGPLLPGVDHLPHTHDLEHNRHAQGQPAWGAHLADALERLVGLHDASTIAAVIVEPMAGACGVLPPPIGYLERLREICTKYGILLIFDEVITGFGRLGANFAANRLGVQPDLITMAKGITNGAVPMGAVAVSAPIYEAFMTKADTPIELFHGFTYSGHPLAVAAAHATLDVYEEEGLFARAAALEPRFEAAVHTLETARNVIDVRNMGLVAGIEVAARPGAPGARGSDIATACFAAGLTVRAAGDTICLSPSLIIEDSHIDQILSILGDALAKVD